MTEQDQRNHFINDVSAVVDRYRDEYELPIASVIGVFEIMKFTLLMEATELEKRVSECESTLGL